MGQETFADRLRAAMSERSLKQADLIRLASERGAKLGKSQVSQYASGKVEPRADACALLADLLGVDASWLAAGEGAPGAARAAARPETAPRPTTAHTTQRSSTMREFKKSSKLENVPQTGKRKLCVQVEKYLKCCGDNLCNMWQIGNPLLQLRSPRALVGCPCNL